MQEISETIGEIWNKERCMDVVNGESVTTARTRGSQSALYIYVYFNILLFRLNNILQSSVASNSLIVISFFVCLLRQRKCAIGNRECL